jgi:hypothetical protein
MTPKVPGERPALGAANWGAVPGVVEFAAQLGLKPFFDGDKLEHADISVLKLVEVRLANC